MSRAMQSAGGTKGEEDTGPSWRDLQSGEESRPRADCKSDGMCCARAGQGTLPGAGGLPAGDAPVSGKVSPPTLQAEGRDKQSHGVKNREGGVSGTTSETAKRKLKR